MCFQFVEIEIIELNEHNRLLICWILYFLVPSRLTTETRMEIRNFGLFREKIFVKMNDI
jgi:hypothetical protein